MDQSEIEAVVERHVRFLDGAPNGVRIEMRRASLNSLRIQNSRLEDAFFEDCAFLNCQLSGADFRDATLTSCKFTGSNLELTNLTRANLMDSQFSQCQAKGIRASKVKAEASIWSLAEIENALFNDGFLIRSDFSEANAREANFLSAQLQGANFRSAKLRRVVFERADLRGVNFTNSVMTRCNLRDSTLIAADLRGANLTSSDLKGADLTDAYLAGADLRDTIGLTCEQLQSSQDWESAIRDPELACGGAIPSLDEPSATGRIFNEQLSEEISVGLTVEAEVARSTTTVPLPYNIVPDPDGRILNLARGDSSATLRPDTDVQQRIEAFKQAQNALSQLRDMLKARGGIGHNSGKVPYISPELASQYVGQIDQAVAILNKPVQSEQDKEQLIVTRSLFQRLSSFCREHPELLMAIGIAVTAITQVLDLFL